MGNKCSILESNAHKEGTNMSNILAKEYRGNVVENIHYGSIAVVSSMGDVVCGLGDLDRITFLRSASKPIQLLPTLLAGLHEKYGLTSEEIAICASSHWGSIHHGYVLESILEKTGLSAEDMIMNPAFPTSSLPLSNKLSMGDKLNPMDGPSRMAHCCFGKHLSLMLLQRELTGDASGYHLPDSPVQKQIISFISTLSQTPTYKMGLGVDGCGVPVFAMPLKNIAYAYARLVDPWSQPPEVQDAIHLVTAAMNAHPEKINDYYTPSYYVNKNPDLIMKDGVGGVMCLAIRSRKVGIAIKLLDGASDEYQGVIIANLLDELNYDAPELKEKLRACYNTKRYNDCGDEIGHFDSDFTFNKNEEDENAND